MSRTVKPDPESAIPAHEPAHEPSHDYLARPYRLIGGPGSPYSMKMRAILRYRRLPFVWLQRFMVEDSEFAHVVPQMIPYLYFPDEGVIRNDSTPLIYALEKRHSERSIVPSDPADAFLAHLVEDMADEWGTKIMYHYRWFYESDQVYYGPYLARGRFGALPRAVAAKRGADFRNRQVSRNTMVGATEQNRPIIEKSYRLVLDIFERQIEHCYYLFGTRPSLADFGWYGQLQPTEHAPIAGAIMREQAPAVWQWLQFLDDTSGVEGEWRDPQGPLSIAAKELLDLAGTLYLPLLAANARSVLDGTDKVEIEALGERYVQTPFKYQHKCWNWLLDELEAVQGEPRRRLQRILEEAGCWRTLVDPL